MRRLFAITATFLVFSGLLLGCRRPAPKNPNDDKTDVTLDVNVKVQPPKDKAGDGVKKDKDDGQPPKVIVAQLPDLKQERYEAAVADGLTAMAARNWQGALAEFELAQSLDDNDFVKAQIADLKGRIDRAGAAKTTTKDIENVLNDGKAEDAAKLAADALLEFGGGDDADRLIALRLQAEAVRAAEKDEKDDARYARFRKEGEAAVAEKNLRAAALAFEQALSARDDADLKTTYDGIRTKLDQYDALRKQAKELRGDPLRQDDALAALNAAKAAWDTLQIRQEIDDCELAKQRRRDTISVADFEVRNEVGMPNAGATLADELFPLLQPKYDLVERAQLKRVFAELNLQAGLPDDAKQQKKVGKLANVRYLVVGSVHRLVGVSVKARLIDVETGLVVQTGKIVAPTMDEALAQMKDLAKQLLAADEANLKADPDKAGQQPDVVAANAVLPLAPPVPDAKAPPPPPPPQMVNVRAPDFAGVKVELFANFKAAPAGFAAPPPDPLAVVQRNRLLFAAVEMGDFLFRAGRFREARQQFEFALMLAPDNFEVRARLERVALLAPPVDPFATAVVRPRLVVLPFMVHGRPSVVPHSLRWWTPANLGPYFDWYGYDVVDSADLYWYMARMGITMNDLMVDPIARRWVARAAGVRYFVFGNCIETNSFEVNTYLIDAELGYMHGFAKINVQNWYELKLRLPELAQVTVMTPEQRAFHLAQQQRVDFFRLMNLGQQHMARKDAHKAVVDFRKALQIYPDNIQARVNLMLATTQARNEDAERDRRLQWEAQQKALADARQRQILMAQAAEAARKRAAADAAARTPAQQSVHVNFRFDGRAKLLTQAQVALKTNNFGMSVSLFQSADTFAAPAPEKPLPAIDYQAFAQAQLKAQKAEKFRATQFALARETALREAREKELADAKAALEAEKIRSQQALDQIRADQARRDLEVYLAGIEKGKEMRGKKKFDEALAAFQAAQRVAQSAKHKQEVNNYITIVVQERAEKTDAKLAEKLAAESERRKQLELKAKENDTKYQAALQAARNALTLQNFDAAEAKFHEAGQIFKTDAVLIGLKQVSSGRADQLAVQQKAEAEKKRAAVIAQLIAEGQGALGAKKYGDAVKSFREAKRLAPDNLDAIAGLTQSEQAYAKQLAVAKEDLDRLKNFQKYLTSGKANLAAKQFDLAVTNLTQAVRLNPADKEAQSALNQAIAGRDAVLGDAKARAAKLQEYITTGQAALKLKNYDAAEKALRLARDLDPANAAVAQGLKDVASGRQALADAQKLMADFQTALNAGEKALAGKDYKSALASFQLALKLMPGDAKASAYSKQAQQGLDLQGKTGLAFQSALDVGEKALALKKYADAVKSLTEATKLDPTNARARTLLAQAQQAFNDAQALTANYQKALTAGEKALAGKDYKSALASFQQALKFMPDDAKASAYAKQAQQGIDLQGKTGLAFQSALDAGEKALALKKYADAVKSFTEATKLDPTNARARTLLVQAQQAFNDAQALTANYQKALTAGEKALAGKDYKSALASFQQALKFMPDDAKASAYAKQAQQGIDLQAKTALAFQNALDAGEKALALKKYDDAVKSFTAATKLDPTNARARTLLAQAQQALTEVQAQANYLKAMTAGNTALTLKKYDDAIKSFKNALTWVPNDPKATQQLAQAQQLMQDSMKKKKDPPPPDPNQPYSDAMQRGAAAEKNMKYADAVKAFTEAIKLRPKDAGAQAGLNKNQFSLNMQQGQQYLDNMMWLEAQREFESALKLFPNNPTAAKLLKKAQNKGK